MPGGSEDGLGLVHAVLRHVLQLGDGVGERRHDDLGAAQRGHLAEVAAVRGLHGVPAEAGGEDPVVGSGGAAALDVAEDVLPNTPPSVTFPHREANC